MAAADYYLCDRCGSKAFYDANITDSRYTGPDDPNDISGMIDITVLCPECAKTHKTIFVEQKPEKTSEGQAMADIAARLVAYGTTPDAHGAPTPDECLAAGQLISVLRGVGNVLYESLEATITNPHFAGEDMIEDYAEEKAILDGSGVTRNQLDTGYLTHRLELEMTEDHIKHMVDRFLGWKLPENFSPDAGITFDPVFNSGRGRHEPVGTNLFDVQQAEEMVRYMVAGITNHRLE